MKIGVFLGDLEPRRGGGFTLADDVFQGLLRVESKHTFFILSNLRGDAAGDVAGKHLQFLPLPPKFFNRDRNKAIRKAAGVLAKLPKVGRRFQNTYPRWLREVVEDFGIELMWFVTPTFINVDIPYIFTVWDLQHRIQPWFPEVSANGRWYTREAHYATAIPRASAVIVGAEAGKEEIVHFYRVPPERVRLIPQPTPRFALDASNEDSRKVLEKYHIPEGYLFYPAQFWPHKNHVGLLRAAKLLQEKYDVIFHLVFTGFDKGNLQYVRRVVDELGLSSKVHFLGFVPQEDLVGLYQNAFSLTFLTFFGPDNLPPLEAFALGCPVIASNVFGAQEQLGDAALLVDPRDEEEIASAIKFLYDDPSQRQTLIRRGLARARKWTGEDYVKRVLTFFDEFESTRCCWSSTERYVVIK